MGLDLVGDRADFCGWGLDLVSQAIEQGKFKINDRMKDETKQEVLEFIHESIAFGFETNASIYDNCLELADDLEDEIDIFWLESEIRRQAGARLESSKTWPKFTDFYNLAVAFDRLCRKKVIAIHCAGFTRQECEINAEAIHDQILNSGNKAIGFCYYHLQDMQSAIDPDSRRLFIGFGEFEGDEDQSLVVGKMVAEELKSVGFTLEWDGTVMHRISIQNFDWQKLPDNEKWGESRVLKFFVQPLPVQNVKPKPWWKFW